MAVVKIIAKVKVEEKERLLIKELFLDASGTHLGKLNDWEMGFLENLYNGSLAGTYTEVYWTEKQISTLEKIERKLYRV